MYSRNSFGSFYPVNSSVHKLNPVVKILLFILSIIFLFITNTLHIHLFLLSLVIVMMLLSYVPFRYYLKTFWFFRYIYLLAFIILAYFKVSLSLSIVYVLKAIIFIEYLNILAFTTSPSEMEYGIEKIMSPFNILFLRTSKIAYKINNMLRYIPRLLNTEYKVLKSMSSRGIDYNHSNIFRKIFIMLTNIKNIIRLTNRYNREVLFASQLRLYNVKSYRTNYRTNKVGFYDIVFILFHLLLLYACIKERGLL